MTEYILHSLDIYACFAHPRCKGVPERVVADLREQNRIFFACIKDFIIAVPDNTAECLIQCALILRVAETVDKDEVGISIHNGIAGKLSFLLILFFLDESLAC